MVLLFFSLPHTYPNKIIFSVPATISPNNHNKREGLVNSVKASYLIGLS